MQVMVISPRIAALMAGVESNEDGLRGKNSLFRI